MRATSRPWSDPMKSRKLGVLTLRQVRRWREWPSITIPNKAPQLDRIEHAGEGVEKDHRAPRLREARALRQGDLSANGELRVPGVMVDQTDQGCCREVR